MNLKNSFRSTAIKIENQKLMILNQRLLPLKEEWIVINHPDDMIRAIKDLSIRGAPLIGVGAALSLCLYRTTESNDDVFVKKAQELREARPTAVNLMNAIDAVLSTDLSEKQIFSKVEEFITQDISMCEKIGKFGADLIEDGDTILTHCNTGSLATAGIGTAIGILATAKAQNKNIHVYVDETRPLLQGARLTTWELEKLQIPYTLICDNMAGMLMKNKKINKIFVGADRIALNGDFANKIGTYSLAVLAHHHEVPFFTAAPRTTIDFTAETGDDIPIEERAQSEVRGVSGSFGEVIWSPVNANTFNPSFDVTPGKLVGGIILETGVYLRNHLSKGILKTLKV